MATFKSVDILAQPDSARIHIAQAATTQTDSGRKLVFHLLCGITLPEFRYRSCE